jgi:hypothetical protein
VPDGSSPRYYLDTSAQIERHGGESAVRQAFAARLGTQANHATSTHVQREWKNIVDQSAAEILNACRGATSVHDVRARLRNGFGRKPGHHWLALDMFGADATTVAEIELRAEQFLRTTAGVLFESGIAEIRDGSECMLAAETARRDTRTGKWSVRTKCKRNECDCAQIALTDHNEDRVERAADALARSRTPGHAKMAQIAREAMAHPDKSRRKGRTCWGGSGLGGDISIALECAEDETLLTTDRSFDEICPAIGVAHCRLAGTRTP